jgi:hypothetical protein
MMLDKLKNYEAILLIRQKAWRRDVALLGGLFVLGLLFVLMVDSDGSGITVITFISVVLGIGILTYWVRLEVVNNSIELLRNLQLAILENQEQEEKRK